MLKEPFSVKFDNLGSIHTRDKVSFQCDLSPDPTPSTHLAENKYGSLYIYYIVYVLPRKRAIHTLPFSRFNA